MDECGPQAMFRAAAALSRAGNDEAAESIFRRLVATHPGDPVLAYNLATTLLRQGKYEGGFRLYEARAYVEMPNVVKPEYRPESLPLPPEVGATWGQQTIDAAEVAAFL